MRIDYNPITGMLEGKAISSEYYLDASLFTNMQAGACVAVIEYSAFQLRSTYNNDYLTRTNPTVDGIVLTNGLAGQQVKIARIKGMQYTFDTPILDSLLTTNELYLDKQGNISLIEPSLVNGDRWYVYIGRKINNYSFIFDPHPPLDLNDPGGIVPPSPYPDPSLDKLAINEAMLAFTCFKVNSNGSASKIKADDVVVPFIDGMTLENGITNQEVLVARIKNQNYNTPFHFATSNVYFLDNFGRVVTPRPNNVLYSCVVGRSIADSNIFIFDPQTPIKLASI